MPLENIKNQEEGGVGSAPKPFDPKDTANIDRLNAKFEGTKTVEKLSNDYMVGQAKVMLDIKSPDVKTSADGKGQTFIFSASVNDPNAPGRFKGENRWVEYSIDVGADGEVGFVNRIDNRGSEGFRPTYQVHGEEVEKLLKTAQVAEYVGPYLKKN